MLLGFTFASGAVSGCAPAVLHAEIEQTQLGNRRIAYWTYQLLITEMLVTGHYQVAAILTVLPFLGGAAVNFYAADEAVAYCRVLKARERRQAEWDRAAGRGRP